MKKVFYIICSIILVFFIVFNFFSIFDLSFFHFKMYKVSTGSMNPYLKIGELIVVKDDADYTVGDIVTYEQNDSYVTHRIVDVSGDTLVTKGDNNNTNDEAINKKQVVGKLVCRLRGLSFVHYLLEKPFTWVLMFLIGVFIIFIIPVRKIIKDKFFDEEII